MGMKLSETPLGTPTGCMCGKTCGGKCAKKRPTGTASAGSTVNGVKCSDVNGAGQLGSGQLGDLVAIVE